MRQRYLTYFVAAFALLLLPSAAHAGCSLYYCDSFAMYDSSTGNIEGYVNYIDYSGWDILYAEAYIEDPNLVVHELGVPQEGWNYVEIDFSYATGFYPGQYAVFSENYYYYEWWQDPWVWDGETYYGVELPPPQPTGETSTAIGPSPAPDAAGLFYATVYDSGETNFSGRTVTENVPLTDTCYAMIPNNTWPDKSQTFSNSWPPIPSVHGPNTYGDDLIGMTGEGSWDWVDYYVLRLWYHSASCGLQGTQSMTMDGGAFPYDVHDLGLYLDWEGTVYSYRAAATVNLQ